jgi:Domain of unknown function (DUF4440)
MTKRLLFLLIGVAFSGAILAQDEDKMGVQMAMLKLRQGILKKDSVALSEVLANEVYYGHTNGMVQTKAQFIRSVMSGEQDYKLITPTDMSIVLYGNSATTTMKSKVSMIYKGAPLEMDMSMLMVWVKKDDIWQLVGRQSVKLGQ